MGVSSSKRYLLTFDGLLPSKINIQADYSDFSKFVLIYQIENKTGIISEVYKLKTGDILYKIGDKYVSPYQGLEYLKYLYEKELNSKTIVEITVLKKSKYEQIDYIPKDIDGYCQIETC